MRQKASETQTDTQTHREDNMKMEAEMGVIQLRAKDCQIAGGHQKLGEGQGKRRPQSLGTDGMVLPML